MRTINGAQAGPIILREDLRLDGHVTGDVTVPSGLRLELNGEIGGNLLLCAGAHAEISGVVRGVLRIEGGSYRLSGQIGSVRRSGGRRYA